MHKKLRALLFFGATLVAFAGNKISPDMPSSGNVDVIIQFKAPPSNGQMQHLGPFGSIHKQFKGINAIQMTLPAALVRFLESDPILTNLAYISPVRHMASTLDITTQDVNANLVWPSGWDGTGVGVAVIDSGVSSKPDFNASNGTSRIVYSQSFISGLDATDQYGHGTHVAGIVAGNGSASTGPGFTRTLKGVAPNANIINLRVLDQNGAGSESAVIAAIDQAIALKNTYNIRVINLSVGHPVYESYTLDPLCQEVEAAYRAGITVVVAAGNDGRDNSLGTHGYATITSPGNDPYVITVGAMNAKNVPNRTAAVLATYSSKGPTLLDHFAKPDLVAPGNGVVSVLASPNCTLAANYPSTLVPNSYYGAPGRGNSTDYFRLSGTSMATPVVSGAVALMVQKDPTLTPDTIKARLMKTAWKALPLYGTGTSILSLASFQTQSDIFAVGAGMVDVNAAMASTDVATLPAMSPAVAYDPTSKHVSLVSGQSIIWGSSIIWGDSIVWGNNVLLSGSSIIWGDSIVWGDSTVNGFSIVWGDSANVGSGMQAMSAGDGDE